MKLVRRNSVNRAFYRRYRFERGVSGARHLFRNLHRIDQPVDFRDGPSMWLGRNIEIDFDASHARAF